MDPENRSDEDDSGLLEPEDSLVDRGVVDALDEGWSPPERPWASTGWGTTAREEADGEPLDVRLAREVPEDGQWDARQWDGRLRDGEQTDGDGLGDAIGTDGELLDDEVGGMRAGRLVAASGAFDDDAELYAVDVGIDGAGASAEEAAVHVVPDGRGPDRY